VADLGTPTAQRRSFKVSFLSLVLMMHAANESRVLVIYCGGTIGMLKSDNKGYVPEPFYLTETLRAQARFHDPHEDSLFSHSNTVQGFRDWSQSGSSTPPRIPSTAHSQAERSSLHTLLVRSSRPITLPQVLPGLLRYPTCTKISDSCYEAHLPSLVTPVGNGPRIRYAVLEVSRYCRFKGLFVYHEYSVEPST
jgi:60kDa lysophospholipase